MKLTSTMRKLNPDAFALPQTAKAASEKYDRNVESKIQNTIETWLESEGVWVVRNRMDKKTRNKPGTPDLIFFYKGFGFALEIKRPGKSLTIEQARALRAFQLHGAIAGWFEDAKEAIDFIINETKP